MIKGIKSRLVSFFRCIYLKLGSDLSLSHTTFVLPPLPNHQPFSDAELEQCRDVLSPLGYIVIRNTEDNEILIYRQRDWQERKKAEELVLQKLKQGV